LVKEGETAFDLATVTTKMVLAPAPSERAVMVMGAWGEET